jgi:vacuolar-type H+-ATPase subunit F/Vma7
VLSTSRDVAVTMYNRLEDDGDYTLIQLNRASLQQIDDSTGNLEQKAIAAIVLLIGCEQQAESRQRTTLAE